MSDEQFKARLRALNEDLRCLVCQNQSLAESNAELAVDLKREVERLMTDGKSDAEIKAYLVQRYGDFVLYKPPVQSNTALLWAGPFVLLAGGAGLWTLIQRRSNIASRQNDAQNQNTQSSQNTQSTREAVKKLLG
jgi:cytochrome c-type biogenesis protein CcmH